MDSAIIRVRLGDIKRLAAERDALREALWQYREYFGHDLQLHDEGRQGCPGCLAESVLRRPE